MGRGRTWRAAGARAALAGLAVLALAGAARAQEPEPLRQVPERALGLPAAQTDPAVSECAGCCRLGFRGYSLALTVEGSLLPIGAAAMGADRTEGVDVVPILAFGQGAVALMEAGTLALAGRKRPLEHWAVILSVRGAATALAFLAGRYLQPGGAVLATTALIAAGTVPLFVLQADETRFLDF